MPKVSVIIPTYNKAKYISEAVGSVLNQTYRDFEIIIVDDGSTDNTREVLKDSIRNNAERIKYIYQDNKGVSESRNFGINNANGEYIAFIDSDDIWFPDKLEKQVKFLENDIELGLVFSKTFLIDEAGNEKGYKSDNINSVSFKGLLDRNFIITSSVLTRKALLKEAGLFDVRYSIAEDYDMWLKLSQRNQMQYIEIPLVKYREVNNGLSRNIAMSHANHIKIFKKYLKNYPKIIRHKIAEEYYLLCKENYDNGRFIKALKYCMNAIIFNMLLGKSFFIKGDSIYARIIKITKPYCLLPICILRALINGSSTQAIKNILFYESSSSFGGSANSLSLIVNNLDRNYFNPIVIIKNQGPQIDKIKDVRIIHLRDYKETEKMSAVLLALYGIKNIIPEVFKILNIIRSERISVIHINNNILLGIPAIVAAKISQKPVVCHIRETRNWTKREIFFARFVNKIIVINKLACGLYAKNISKKKVKIIYNGFLFKKEIARSRIGIIYDGLNLEHTLTDARNSALRKEYGFNSDPLVCLPGRIIRGKGQKEFILSAKEVLKFRSHAKFIVVGDSAGYSDGYYEEVSELVRNEKLENSVIFTGWRKDITNIIADSDIVVLASTTFPEGLPNTIIEAMALSKPVVATDIPGPSDIVEDGMTGFLVPPENIHAMADKIKYLLDNHSIARRMGEAGRKRAEDLFDIKKNVKEIEQVYKDLINNKA